VRGVSFFLVYWSWLSSETKNRKILILTLPQKKLCQDRESWPFVGGFHFRVIVPGVPYEWILVFRHPVKELACVFFDLLCRCLVLETSGDGVVSDIPRGVDGSSYRCVYHYLKAFQVGLRCISPGC